ILVTGASGAIGLETPRLFLTQGAKVTAHYNTNAIPLDTLSAEFGVERVLAAQANLSAEDDVGHMFAAANEALGPVQVIVINHAVYPMADDPVATMALDRWRATLDANLTSPFLVAREFLRQLETGHRLGRREVEGVDFIRRVCGWEVWRCGAGGLRCKQEWPHVRAHPFAQERNRQDRGRVNSVAPGWVRTPLGEDALKDPSIVYHALATCVY
ncbi:hypothetical protein C8R44DRAFT_932274, partial [Mycena epipterygia]